MIRLTSRFTVLLGAVPMLANAQQATLPIRQLGPILTVSKDMLPSIASIRALSHGRVIANDPVSHRVILLDSAMSAFTVVADTTSGTNKAYGNQAGGLIPYLGDSTLFVDVASLSLVVISPQGKIARVMAVPRTEDILSMALQSGGAAFDAQGKLVYRQSFSIKMPSAKAGPTVSDTAPAIPDSSPIVRMDLKTRVLDTVAKLRLQPTQFATMTGPNGATLRVGLRNPLPVSDDWALLADGSIAVVRAQDYHIDWITPAGARSSTPKIQHEWVRLTDSGKVAVLDSVKRADSLAMLKNPGQGGGGGAGGGTPIQMNFSSDGGGGGGGGGGSGGGGGQMSVSMSSDGIGNKIMMVTSGGDGGGGGPPMPGGPSAMRSLVGPPQYIAAADLPDYRPAFIPSSTGRLETRADADGNVWIHINVAGDVTGGPVYEVVNRKGELVDRVQVPGGCTIVGFAPGVVYLTSRDGAGVRLARARIR